MASETRGVENPIASDAALIGDTCNPLAKAALPRRTGPTYNLTGEGAKDDQFRVEGKGEKY